MNYIIKCDTHTHTSFTRHAYSTLEENIRAAKKRNMELIGTTDHFSSMLFSDYEDIKSWQYIITMPVLPEEIDGIRHLRAAEVDIESLDGRLFGQGIPAPNNIVGQPFHKNLDLFDRVTEKLDYLIASIHGDAFCKGASVSQVTDAYIKALEHDKVFILGHVGRSGQNVDFDEILKAAKSMNKLLEINEHSFEATENEHSRRCRHIAERAAELGCPISVSSDAHFSSYIGKYDRAIKMLNEIHFPYELIADRNKESFMAALSKAGL